MNEETEDFDSLLKSAYESDRGIYNMNFRMGKEVKQGEL
jgi:hypothetical protein